MENRNIGADDRVQLAGDKCVDRGLRIECCTWTDYRSIVGIGCIDSSDGQEARCRKVKDTALWMLDLNVDRLALDMAMAENAGRLANGYA